MSGFLQDMRTSMRTLWRSPGYVVATVATLAVGIGATTAIFSVVNALLLRRLPYEDPDRLVMVWETFRQQREGSVSYPNLADWRTHSEVFERLAGFHLWPQTLTGFGNPERVMGALVTADFFPALRVRPALGRLFGPDDDRPDADNVLVVTDGFWRSRLSADPSAVGRVITLTGLPFKVVGVLPPGFRFPVRIGEAEMFTSAGMEPREQEQRGWPVLTVLGRLNPGATIEQAQAQVNTIQDWLATEYPDTSRDHGLRVVPLHEQVVGQVRTLLGLLSAAAIMLLVVACANVANLGLARATVRRRELAVRAAVGGGRWQLARLLLLESTTLGLAGGILGVLLALWGVELLRGLLPPSFPLAGDIAVDLRVLAFSLLVALLSGVAVGLVPVARASGAQPSSVLKEGPAVGTAPGRHRLAATLVSAQVALALVLLVGAGLLIRSVQQLGEASLGFDTQRVLTFRMYLGWDHRSTSPDRAAMYEAILERLRGLPGVESVSGAACLPLSGNQQFPVYPTDRPVPEAIRDWFNVQHNSVSEDYFQTLGIPLLAGRTFTALDQRDSRPGAVIINEALARELWPDESPLGKQLRSCVDIEPVDPNVFEVVGVVGDAREVSVEANPAPCAYFCYHQQTFPYMGFLLKTTQAPELLAEAARKAVAQVTDREAVFRIRTLEETLRDSSAFMNRRVPLLLLVLFAGVAVLLSGLGIYSLLSYMVSQRQHEIGVRLALGAQRRAVLQLVLRRGLVPTLCGMAAGLLVALLVTRLLQGQLYGITATDPATFAGVTALVVAVALGASYWPARRATNVDPLVSLRCE
ncbi:MAG TPA: ABC transporter permease [Phycisphaerae bacterium]|nr:ABC transporter permease [Phycisphaerae bacterium]HNU44253.1 ABC transporter permease [Phycisphaerae bacterium]